MRSGEDGILIPVSSWSPANMVSMEEGALSVEYTLFSGAVTVTAFPS